MNQLVLKNKAEYIDMPKLFSSNNYNKVFSIKTEVELLQIFPDFINSKGSKFFRDANKKQAQKDLGRPTIKPVDNKEAIQAFLRKS